MTSRNDSQDAVSTKSGSSKFDHHVAEVAAQDKNKTIANMSAWPSTKDGEIEHAIVVESEHNTSTGRRAEAGDIQSSHPSHDEDLEEDTSPPPDGGVVAWTQCLAAHLTNVTTFG
jgi:hypothetical protein